MLIQNIRYETLNGRLGQEFLFSYKRPAKIYEQHVLIVVAIDVSDTQHSVEHKHSIR